MLLGSNLGGLPRGALSADAFVLGTAAQDAEDVILYDRGTGRLWGPVVGVIPFTFLWEGISASVPNQTTLLLGVAFLVIVYVLPRGFVGLIEDARARVNRAEGYA